MLTTLKRLIFAAILFVPFSASANAGTPLMWAGMLHLAFGNALIGLVEGLLIAILFKQRKWLCVTIMIIANYFSAWIGAGVLGQMISSELDLDLYSAWPWVWRIVGITFLLTLLLEWPFVVACLRKAPSGFRKSVAANLAIQVFSYAVLIAWYWSASEVSLYTDLRAIHPREARLDRAVLLAFIDPADGHVNALTLPGGQPRKLVELGSTNSADRLVVRRGSAGAWDLAALINGQSGGEVITLISNVSATGILNHGGDEVERNTRFNYGYANAIDGVSTNGLRYWVGFWGSITVEGTATQQPERFGFETPFVAWMIRNATQISQDQVVFQLGDDQICVLDRRQRYIALLARGRGPVVVPADSDGPSVARTALGIK